LQNILSLKKSYLVLYVFKNLDNFIYTFVENFAKQYSLEEFTTIANQLIDYNQSIDIENILKMVKIITENFIWGNTNGFIGILG